MLFVSLLITAASSEARLWPQPLSFTSGSPASVDPCSVSIRVSSVPLHLQEAVDYFRTKVLRCKAGPSQQYFLTVSIGNSSLLPPDKVNEGYSLNLTNKNWTLKTAFYPGLVRGLQTFGQLFYQEADSPKIDLPALVEDRPFLPWRAVMIDTSRHFLPKEKILQTIDVMAANKLNVLHWHICDDDSFPLNLTSVPELAGKGAFPGQVYSRQDILQIQAQALRRGVRVVPEIDTPSHTFAWSKSSGAVLVCGSHSGQFDPTLDETYQLVGKVIKEVAELFTDPVIHLGGDEPNYDCFDQRPAIKEFMRQQNIPDYPALCAYYRRRQKQALKQLLPNKQFMYWGVSREEHFEDDDLVNWWGNEKQFQLNFGNRTNGYVIAFYDRLYLDVGFWGYPFIRTWRVGYQTQLHWPNSKGKLLGIEVCLWTQVSNPTTHIQKLADRAAAAAQRGWNSAVFSGSSTNYSLTVARLAAQIKRLTDRGLAASPVTSQFCEKNPTLCFI